MVNENILAQFGKFITTDNLEEKVLLVADERAQDALAPFGKMLVELERKVSGPNLDNSVISTLIVNQTWEKPAGFNRFHVVCIGGGAGGQVGTLNRLWGTATGGTGGGGGGCSEQTFSADTLPDRVAVVIGEGASAGKSGSETQFGSFLQAGGGLWDGQGGFGSLLGGTGGRQGEDGAAGVQGVIGGSGAGGGGGGHQIMNSSSSVQPFPAGRGGRSGTAFGGTSGGIKWVGGWAPDVPTGSYYGGAGGGGGGLQRVGGKGARPGGGGGGGGGSAWGEWGAAGSIHIIAFYE